MTNAAEYLQRLESEIAREQSMLVAFSGGVDSAVLAAAAARVLGDRAAAVTADSASLAREELAIARATATAIGIRHIVLTTGELSREEYARNDQTRCYWCKRTLFDSCAELAAKEGFSSIAYGFTADDVGDYRPGHEAAQESSVRAPLHAAGLGKAEIRAIAVHLGLAIHDKPAAPCLASRIPYGSRVTEEKLSQIESMEQMIRGLGFREIRARFDGSLMRIEVPAVDIPKLVEPGVRDAILAHANERGVPLVTIDLEGFASGKLNRPGLQ